jgi:hypothetical protein
LTLEWRQFCAEEAGPCESGRAIARRSPASGEKLCRLVSGGAQMSAVALAKLGESFRVDAARPCRTRLARLLFDLVIGRRSSHDASGPSGAGDGDEPSSTCVLISAGGYFCSVARVTDPFSPGGYARLWAERGMGHA